MTGGVYRYPSTEDDVLGIEVARRWKAWVRARSDRDAALRAFYDAARDEILAGEAFAAIADVDPADQ